MSKMDIMIRISFVLQILILIGIIWRFGFAN